jgi:hypothetical protein
MMLREVAGKSRKRRHAIDSFWQILWSLRLALLFVGGVWILNKGFHAAWTPGEQRLRKAIHRLRTRRRHEAFDQHRCAHCGYDLRASTNRCPECGHHIPLRPIF